MSATTNWAGNVRFTATEITRPGSVEALQQTVSAAARVKALGTAHSFSTVADSTGVLVSLAALPAEVDIDTVARTVRVAAGLRFGELAAQLDAAGLALHNMGSLPHISVAGACATATHGSGVGNGNLSSAVVALDYILADGSLISVGRGHPDFAGSVVALGALGVVTHVTLAVVPAFEMRQWVYEGLRFEDVVESFDEVVQNAYSVSLFTTWEDDRFATTWLKRRVGDEPAEPATDWLGGRLADGPRHPIQGMPVENCTQQGGVPGRWHERLPHFRLEFTPSTGDELQTEYFVPLEAAPEALRALDAVKGRTAPLTQVSEIRTVAADELWLSPAYQRDSVALHFTWIADTAAVLPVVGVVEEALDGFDARPHWGKVFTMRPDVVRSRSPRVADFEELARRMDPHGKFRNDFLDTYVELA